MIVTGVAGRVNALGRGSGEELRTTCLSLMVDERSMAESGTSYNDGFRYNRF